MENFTAGNTDDQSSVTFGSLLGVLVVTGVVANGYIILVLLQKTRRSAFNLTLVNLAVVDILILLLVIPMCLVTLTLPDVTASLCSVTGMIGQTLVTYSLHVQCLILYANFRTVTKVSTNGKSANYIVRLSVISVTCLALDTCVAVYPSVKHGVLQNLPSVGYCFYTFSNTTLWFKVIVMFYTVHISASVLLCTMFYVILTRFMRKNSARPSLARQRNVYVFKTMFRKLLIWVLSYSFILLTRVIGYRNMWSEVTFQLSYFLLWSNSVLNPLCHILTSPLRRTIVPRCLALVATAAPQRGSHVTDQPRRSSNQLNIPPSRGNAEQSETVTAPPQYGQKKSVSGELSRGFFHITEA